MAKLKQAAPAWLSALAVIVMVVIVGQIYRRAFFTPPPKEVPASPSEEMAILRKKGINPMKLPPPGKKWKIGDIEVFTTPRPQAELKDSQAQKEGAR